MSYMTEFLWCVSMGSLPPVAGKSSPLPIWTHRHPDDLQLHSDQPVPGLSSTLSPSVSRWLEGERYPSGDAVRARVRTGARRLLSSRRSWRCFLSRMVRLQESRLAVL